MKTHLRLFVLMLLSGGLLAVAADSDELSDLKAQLEVLKQQMSALGQQLKAVAERIEHQEAARPVALKLASEITGPTDSAASGAERHGFLERKPGDALTFNTPGCLLYTSDAADE